MKNNHMTRWVLIALLVLAGGYVLIDHGQHVARYLPLAFLLGCLFMHLFGHGGHGGSHIEHQSKN
jgi:hypothetical protein